MEKTEKIRNSNIDLIKFICAFGVISFHTQTNTAHAHLLGDFFSPLRIPFFLLVSVVFFISSIENTSLGVLATKIWKRVVIPYLIWTLIYFSLVSVKHLLSQEQVHFNDWWRTLFFGASAIQMYFIPKMIMMQAMALGFFLILKPTRKSRNTGGLILLGVFCWMGFGAYYDCIGFTKDDFIVNSLYIFLAFYLVQLKAKNGLKKGYGFLGLGFIVLVLLFKYHYLTTNAYFSHVNYYTILGGLGLTLVAFALPSFAWPPKFALVFSFSYGIYLSHILFLEAFETLLSFTHGGLMFTFWVKLYFSVAVLAASILFIFFVKQRPVLRRFLLGE